MTLYERNDGLISKNEFEELSKVNFIDIPDEIKKFIGLHGDIDIHTISAVRVDGEYYSEDEFDGGKRQKRATEDILKYHGVTVYDLDKALLQEPRMFLEEGTPNAKRARHIQTGIANVVYSSLSAYSKAEKRMWYNGRSTVLIVV